MAAAGQIGSHPRDGSHNSQGWVPLMGRRRGGTWRLVGLRGGCRDWSSSRDPHHPLLEGHDNDDRVADGDGTSTRDVGPLPFGTTMGLTEAFGLCATPCSCLSRDDFVRPCPFAVDHY